jgi:hypothetical protein
VMIDDRRSQKMDLALCSAFSCVRWGINKLPTKDDVRGLDRAFILCVRARTDNQEEKHHASDLTATVPVAPVS